MFELVEEALDEVALSIERGIDGPLHLAVALGWVFSPGIWLETVLAEEGRPPESVFDFVQGITAVARSKPQQDARLVMEGNAKALLEKVA